MISNERPAPDGSRRPPTAGPAKPPVEELILKTETVQIERKKFTLTLKENARGRFLKITEDPDGRRDTVIIPATGLEMFQQMIVGVIQIGAEVDHHPPN